MLSLPCCREERPAAEPGVSVRGGAVSGSLTEHPEAKSAVKSVSNHWDKPAKPSEIGAIEKEG